MKVLMPYIDIGGGGISDPKINGGTELFSRLVNNNFDVEVVNIPWTTTRNENPKYVNTIRAIAEDKKCDIILSNNIKSVCLKLIQDIGIPIMHITHTNYGLMKAPELLRNFTNFGHSIYGVSDSNIAYMSRLSKRLHEPEVEYSGTIAPAYCSYDLEVNKTPTNNIVTVGRSNSYKGPFTLIDKIRGGKYNPIVITSRGVDEDSVEYYDKNKQKPHILDLNHNEVMNHLQNASASMITCTKETFGIAALESLSVGTPVLIKCDKSGTHASAEIAADSSHYCLFPATEKSDTILTYVDKLVKVDRNEIKQMTQEKHSKKNWVNNLSNAFDTTVEKYKKTGQKVNSSLEEFF
jgi:glycosyltransferase involved in cell wall biosynthesis